MKYNLLMLIIMIMTGVIGCQSLTDPEVVENTVQENRIACPELRSPMCTKEYNPVCATLINGGRSTYSNGCSACANQNVQSWVVGKFED